MTARPDLSELRELYRSQVWRLDHLYKIVDKQGELVTFKMNPMQHEVYFSLGPKNIVLKARQHGVSTLGMMLLLDYALFNPYFRGGAIAHSLPDAKALFQKVKLAYEHLPNAVKEMVTARSDTQNSYEFSNGSTLRVAGGFRSTTLDLLWISELGKIAARTPEKSVEIRTGSIPAVPDSGIVVVESTSEGNYGYLFELVEEARAMQEAGGELGPNDYNLVFQPWHQNDQYIQIKKEVITEQYTKYFADLAVNHGITLTVQQKFWYISRDRSLGENMFREFPSTIDECFMASISGAYFAKQMTAMRKENRLTNVPVHPGLPVDVFFDIGHSDSTAMWFCQKIGQRLHVVHYYENSGEGLRFYRDKAVEIAQARGMTLGVSYFPHDMGVVDYSTGVSRIQAAIDMGMNAVVGGRMPDKHLGIEAARGVLPHCVIDQVHCADGIKALTGYRKAWDEKHGTWSDKPLHSPESDGADAFQYLALHHHELTQVHQELEFNKKTNSRYQSPDYDDSHWYT